MNALRYTLALALVALVCQQTSLAQADPWDRLKVLEQGNNVKVSLLSGKTVAGKMQVWTADGLTVRQGKNKLMRVERAEVTEVVLLLGKSRSRKAAFWGLITGSIGGVMVGALSGYSIGDTGERVLVGAGAFLLYGVIGGGIAALSPQKKMVLYTAPDTITSKK